MASFVLFALLFAALIVVVFIIANWRIFEKAGKPGWHSLIPYLSTYDLIDVSWSSTAAWVGVAFTLIQSILSGIEQKYARAEEMLPSGLSTIIGIFSLVYLIFTIVYLYKLSVSFGHGVGFTIGLILLAPIFILILAFGSSAYIGPNGQPVMTGFNTGFGDKYSNVPDPNLGGGYDIYGQQGAPQQQGNPFENGNPYGDNNNRY